MRKKSTPPGRPEIDLLSCILRTGSAAYNIARPSVSEIFFAPSALEVWQAISACALTPSGIISPATVRAHMQEAKCSPEAYQALEESLRTSVQFSRLEEVIEELSQAYMARAAKSLLGDYMDSHVFTSASLSELQQRIAELASNSATMDIRMSMLDELRFSVSKPIREVENMLSFQGKPFASKGNIVVIGGKKKAGKSALVSALLGASMAGKPEECLGFSCLPNSKGYAVIHVDTEQSLADHAKLARRSLRNAALSKEPDWFASYPLIQASRARRKQDLIMLPQVLSQRHGGIHMIVLDGITDIVRNPNDLEESGSTVEMLSNIATSYDCLVVVVIHIDTASESNKLRGHLGSELERKAEAIMTVQQQRDHKLNRLVRTFSFPFLRSDPISGDFEFDYDPGTYSWRLADGHAPQQIPASVRREAGFRAAPKEPDAADDLPF